jgi:hypothetical protein
MDEGAFQGSLRTQKVMRATLREVNVEMLTIKTPQ